MIRGGLPVIRKLSKNDDLAQIKALLKEAFPKSYDTNEALEKDVSDFLKEAYLVFIDIEKNEIKGLIGAMPQYGHTGYELHPLVVKKTYRQQGIGKNLLKTLEATLAKQGCLILYLGTDDEDFQTSLSQRDIYEDPLEALKNIKNLANHPYTFYLKHHYKLLGVIPDANGINKPDIIMGKRLIP